MNTPAVQLSGITKRFGEVVANDDVDFTLEQGSVHALVGENGAGKTTLMNVLYGLYRPNSGTISVDGTARTFDSPSDAIDAGIGMIHQHFKLVDTMTVLQNIVLGQEPTTGFGLVDAESSRDRIRDICENYGFEVHHHLDDRIEQLGVGTQQRVEIVKSLYRGADVLILDEPTAVLTPQEVDRLYEMMAELTDRGLSLIFITHKLDEAMAAADDITVLRDGEVVGTVDADTTSRAELARMMVGRDVLFEVEPRTETPGDRVLDVTDLTVTDDRDLTAVQEVDLDVRAGEVLGIAGVEGNGQHELVEAITGLRRPTEGRVRLHDTDITRASRRERIESGIAYIPEDRRERGVVLEYDLVENALLGNQTRDTLVSKGFIDWDAVREHADTIVEDYDVQPPLVDAKAASFSGGNQQKFIVGREFEHDPDLVVAAHPTRGVDVGSIEYIHERLLEMRDEGTAVLLVSSKLDEIQKLSDRVAVMYEGAFTDVVNPDDVTEEDIGLLMAGRTPSEIDSTTDDDEAHRGGGR